MRIVIDLTALSYHMTGIERYAFCISKKILEIDTENEYILLFRNQVYQGFEKFLKENRCKYQILHGNNKLLFYQVIMPFHLYKIKADRYLFFAFTSPILFFKKGIYNTIHDMGAWDAAFAMKQIQKYYFRISFRVASKVSKGIITVSNFSKRRIIEILKVSEEKIKVIPSALSDDLCIDDSVDYNHVKDKYNLPDKYIMSLSTLEPRKNLGLLLKAYSMVESKVDYELVLVGRTGWKIQEFIEDVKSQNKIHVTGFVEDKEVSYIYKNALCFVFPSKYEGFGLPPLEALAFNTPVISSDAASMPEVLGDTAVYFKNDNLEELSNLLLNLKSILNSMPRCLSKHHREEFSFDISAKKLIEYINNDE